jgi:hypothetical protein
VSVTEPERFRREAASAVARQVFGHLDGPALLGI